MTRKFSNHCYLFSFLWKYDFFFYEIVKIFLLNCRFFNNAYYARVGGVSTAELNKLEMKFLFSLDFQLHVSVDTFGKYCLLLEKEGNEVHQIERSIQACRLKETWSAKDDTTLYYYNC